MLKALIVFLLFCGGCMSVNKKTRDIASDMSEEGIIFLDFYNYQKIDQKEHKFRIKNLRDEVIYYKVSTSNHFGVDEESTTCHLSADNFIKMETNEECQVTLLFNQDNQKGEFTFTLGDDTTITKYISFKNYNSLFCSSYLRIIHKNFSVDTNALENYMRVDNSSAELIYTEPFINDCNHIREPLDDSFDSVHVYQHCIKKLNRKTIVHPEQMTDFEINNICPE